MPWALDPVEDLIFNKTLNMLKSQKVSATYFQSSACLGTWKGNTINTAASGTPLSPCSTIPLLKDEEYSVFEMTLPGKLFESLCPLENPDESLTFCMVWTMCGTPVRLPTFGIVLNKNAMTCVTSDDGEDTASGGLAAVLAEFEQVLGPDLYGYALSPTADLEMKVKVFTGDGLDTVNVKGNFFNGVTSSSKPKKSKDDGHSDKNTEKSKPVQTGKSNMLNPEYIKIAVKGSESKSTACKQTSALAIIAPCPVCVQSSLDCNSLGLLWRCREKN